MPEIKTERTTFLEVCKNLAKYSINFKIILFDYKNTYVYRFKIIMYDTQPYQDCQLLVTLFIMHEFPTLF